MAVRNRIRAKDGTEQPVSPATGSGLRLRLITSLCVAIALAMLACAPEQTTTEPSDRPSLVRVTGTPRRTRSSPCTPRRTSIRTAGR
jgi:hypothetical protein